MSRIEEMRQTDEYKRRLKFWEFYYKVLPSERVKCSYDKNYKNVSAQNYIEKLFANNNANDSEIQNIRLYLRNNHYITEEEYIACCDENALNQYTERYLQKQNNIIDKNKIGGRDIKAINKYHFIKEMIFTILSIMSIFIPVNLLLPQSFCKVPTISYYYMLIIIIVASIFIFGTILHKIESKKLIGTKTKTKVLSGILGTLARVIVVALICLIPKTSDRIFYSNMIIFVFALFLSFLIGLRYTKHKCPSCKNIYGIVCGGRRLVDFNFDYRIETREQVVSEYDGKVGYGLDYVPIHLERKENVDVKIPTKTEQYLTKYQCACCGHLWETSALIKKDE